MVDWLYLIQYWHYIHLLYIKQLEIISGFCRTSPIWITISTWGVMSSRTVLIFFSPALTCLRIIFKLCLKALGARTFRKRTPQWALHIEAPIKNTIRCFSTILLGRKFNFVLIYTLSFPYALLQTSPILCYISFLNEDLLPFPS